jgi:hypothetical protein
MFTPMQRGRSVLLLLVYVLLVIGITNYLLLSCDEECKISKTLTLGLESYTEDPNATLLEILSSRIESQPFNLVSLALFFFAIVHTFLAHHFTVLAKIWRDWNIQNNRHPVDSFAVETLRFLGEVEVIFGVWVIPLFLSIAYYYDWQSAVSYLNGLHFTEPMFVVVIMALTSTKPIIRLAEDLLKFVAKLFGESSASWWWVILTVGPISGSLITEPGAMTISALLLAKHFYRLKPSVSFSYGTLGLLFTNISVGGVFTHFAAPAVIMVSKPWHWGTSYMMTHFGWKAALGILISNFLYYMIFRKEFVKLDEKRNKLIEKSGKEDHDRVPFWISMVHVMFLAWTVVHNYYPVMFIGIFLLFLGFYHATATFQEPLNLKPPILVGFFLAGLIVHGTLQAWWIAPLLTRVSSDNLFLLSGILTSFNDNAEITFLATLIPTFDEAMKYAIVAGAVTGGGLTVIANAPNPLGQSVLGKYFDQGISAVQLLLGALAPACIVGLCFYLFKGIG